MMSSITLKDYYVAYIDILGMKYKIKTYSDNDFEQLCNQISELVNSILESNESNEKYGMAHIDFHMFSDNMIFLCKDVATLIDFIALLQRRIMVQLRLLIKGGLNQGSIYYDKGHFLLGKGLLYAYELDKNYHRAANRFDKVIADRYELGTIIKKLDDEEFIIDYLYNDFCYDPIDAEENDLPIHKNIIIEGLKNSTREDVLEKYEWLKKYHNVFCMERGYIDLIIE